VSFGDEVGTGAIEPAPGLDQAVENISTAENISSVQMPQTEQQIPSGLKPVPPSPSNGGIQSSGVPIVSPKGGFFLDSHYISVPQFEKPYWFFRADSDGTYGFFPANVYTLKFPKTVGYSALHYAGAAFEGILAVPSETKENVVNILTIDSNVARLMRSMEAFMLKERPYAESMERTYEIFLQENPTFRPHLPKVPKYIAINEEMTKDAIIKAVKKNYESGALDKNCAIPFLVNI